MRNVEGFSMMDIWSVRNLKAVNGHSIQKITFFSTSVRYVVDGEHQYRTLAEAKAAAKAM